ncbi:hypothetical protein ACF0H5_001711 [Mactra antiquata]
MARGKNKRTVIQVKSAPTTNVVFNLVDVSTETNTNVQHFPMLPKLIQVVPLLNDNTTDEDDDHGALETQRESPEDYVAGMKQITPRLDESINRMEDKFIEVNMKTEAMADSSNVGRKIDEVQGEISVKKSKKKNKRKKKKKATDKRDSEAPESCIENGRPVRLEPINKVVNASDSVPNPTTVIVLKPVGCFGFISTWIAKRKEKRRQKKKKAINARKVANTEPLVEYEHRQARGGVAFTIELDSRPIMKSVLPPIKQRPGPIRMATEQKLELADNNRAEHINKRKENARAHSRMVQEVTERRVENEMQFKQTTLLKIRDKEFKATRAPSRFEYDRNMRCQSRCKSRMRQTPDMFTSKVDIALSSSPLAEVNEMPSISPLSLDDVPLPQYFTSQDDSRMFE